MSGRIHSKGVMILSGYLGGKYAENRPISLSASLGFEQQYEEIEGDSASSAELYALLSSLSGFPINQGIAVTGSVNQRGDVQPIGGLMQKINGYFAVCKAKGFTGKQGVLIPKANVRNLMLGEEIIEAVKEGKFHIYPVETIDQGIEILTGKEAGYPLQDGTYPQGSVNSAVSARLEELAENWREYEKRDD
jgi:predicted ATP-dependent protease